MPELPEVEHARRVLHREAAGRRVVAVEVPDPAVVRSTLSTRPSDAVPDGAVVLRERLVGATAGVPLRHGKRLGWRFTGPDSGWLLHLGMSGKWVRRDGTPRHGRLGLVFDTHAVWLVDPRRFGCVTPVDAVQAALARDLGPDALTAPPDGATLASRAGSRPIKVALLDQAVLAGLGNIHAAEVLWRAGIHPFRSAREVSAAEWERLAADVAPYLAAAIAAEDPDEIRYLSEGGAPSEFAVYGRADLPCRACGAPIQVARQAGRATFWCATCQPGP